MSEIQTAPTTELINFDGQPLGDTNKDGQYGAAFTAKGSMLLGLFLSNLFLTLMTLGIYASWAKVRKYKMVAQNTVLNNAPFEFHGTGKELFKGRMRVMAVFGGFFVGIYFLSMINPLFGAIGQLVFAIFSLFLYPVLYISAFRYRSSRTSWNGVHFWVGGSRKEIAKVFYLNVFLTIITLGLLAPFISASMFKYVWGNLHLGKYKFSSDLDTTTFWLTTYKGYIVTVLTLGLLYPFWVSWVLRYQFSTLKLEGHSVTLDLQKGKMFKLIWGNVLLMVFTLGIGYAWVFARTYRYLLGCLVIAKEANLEEVTQADLEVRSALGEEAASFLDFDL